MKTTATRAGASPAATRAANHIMGLDGLAPVRRTMTEDYTVDMYAATWARIIDQETGLPEMLAACKRILASLRWSTTDERMNDVERRELLKTAIAKAENTN